MAKNGFEPDVVRELREAGRVIGRLAKDEQMFRIAFEAFQAGDRKGFREALERFDLIHHCDIVCEWIRTKECLFLCFELCGLPRPLEHQPDPRVLAEAVIRLTSNEHHLRTLAGALEKRDAKAFHRIVDEYNLGPFCHYFCHWVCVVRYRLRCRWVCSLDLIEQPDLIRELQSAGRALRELLGHKESFQQAVAASNAGDAAGLRSILEGVGLHYCHWICEWFCSWRCTLACLLLCRPFPPVEIKDPLKEAFTFAGVLGDLAERSAELDRLAKAVGAGDAKAFAGQVEELKLQRFCHQLCHWICTRRRVGFCRWVCPPIFYHPWFTHVGDFGIYADIDPGTGLTNKLQAGHGGPDFGFFGCLSLRGFCPKRAPANPSEAMAYRFLFQPVGGVPTPITGGFVCEVQVGSRYTLWNGNPFTLQTVRIRGGGATTPTPPPPGPGPTPPDHYIVPDANGWVHVDLNALDDAFSGPLMGMASTVAFPGGAPQPGVAAGTAVPLGNRRNGFDARIIFQATRVSTIAAVNGGIPPDYTNQVTRIHINNWEEVRLLDLLQFHSGGGNPCSPLSVDLDIEYTTDHEVLADWRLTLSTASGMALTSPPSGPTAAQPRGDAGTYHENIAAWPTCSYAVQLHTRRRLTDGLVDDPAKVSQVTFCIGR